MEERSDHAALRENAPEAEFKKHSRPEGEDMKMYDASGQLHVHHGLDEGGQPPQRPEDIRPNLRQILLDACPADSATLNHSLKSAVPLGNGQHRRSGMASRPYATFSSAPSEPTPAFAL